MKRSREEKSPWVKTKAKTGPQKKKSGEFGDEKKKIPEDSDKGSWFDQIDEEKPGASALASRFPFFSSKIALFLFFSCDDYHPNASVQEK